MRRTRLVVGLVLLLVVPLAAACDAASAGGDSGAADAMMSTDVAGGADTTSTDVASADVAFEGDAVAAVDVTAPDSLPDAAPDDTGSAIVPDATSDAAPDEVAAPQCPPDEAYDPVFVSGLLYLDGNASSTSLYAQTYDPPIDAPLAGVTVGLVGADVDRTVETCSDGVFSFGAVPPGLYVLDPEVPSSIQATSTNRAPHFAAAVREGAVNIVAFGDSVPIYSPERPFPERFGDIVAQIADVEVHNVAVSGSVTEDWLPGAGYFEQRLAPLLPDADVVVFTLGGNDVLHYLQHLPSSTEEAVQMMAGVHELFGTILAHVEETVAEIHARAPQADIVYCLYPDYADSDQWAAYLGDYVGLVRIAMGNEWAGIRREMATVDGIVLADLYEATKDVNVTALLIDPLHLTDAGADVYAREIFLALGGVYVEDGVTVGARWFGFAEDPTAAPAP